MIASPSEPTKEGRGVHLRDIQKKELTPSQKMSQEKKKGEWGEAGTQRREKAFWATLGGEGKLRQSLASKKEEIEAAKTV